MFILFVSIILIPFILVKSIEKLKFVSVFAILSIGTFSVLVIYNFFTIEERNKNNSFTFLIPDDFNIKRALASMPTIILAFNWQFNLFPIYKGMVSVTDKNLLISTFLGFIIGSTLYLIVGILGYATYGNNVIFYI